MCGCYLWKKEDTPDFTTPPRQLMTPTSWNSALGGSSTLVGNAWTLAPSTTAITDSISSGT